MEVVLAENHRIPAVSHMLWFKVGSADDPEGKSGLAHYVEHMMFQGTPTVASGEYARRIAGLGGQENAFTSYDYTAFYVNIAKEHLAEVMELEADRLQHLAPREADFLRERNVIVEERRMRVDNNPQAMLAEQMNAALYLNHPYHRPVIGWKHEMENLRWEDVKSFIDAHYTPANAILVVIGDITAEELKPLAEKYYGSMDGRISSERRWKDEPPPRAARRVELHHENVTQPAFEKIYMAPSLAYGDKQQAIPLWLLAHILGGGEASRLHQALVVKQALATHVSVDYDGIQKGPGDFSISILPAAGVTFAVLEAALEKEMEKVRVAPVSAEELERAKTLLKADVIYTRDGLQGMAMVFGRLRAIGLPASMFDEWAGWIETTTARQVKDSAAALLQGMNAVTGVLLPVTKAGAHVP